MTHGDTTRPDPQGATPLPADALRAWLLAMPKVELHCHLDGSVRAETLLELARASDVPLPYTDVDALRAYMRADDARDLAQYLERFDITIAVMQTAEAVERIAYELVEDAARDGVRYIEVRNAPALNTHGGLSLDDVMHATLRGLARGEQAFGTQARFIVCSLRHWTPDISLEMARLAVRFADEGVVGFDLAGGEAGNPAAVHAEAFAYARAHGMPVTCHAGEAAGPESIRQALDVCGAMRIGHGVRAREDAALVHELAERRIPLELCPTSNVQTHAVASYADHPLRTYLAAGIPVTINTDNRLISGVTLTDEFTHAISALGMTPTQLARCVRNAAEAAFLPCKEREMLVARIAEALDAHAQSAPLRVASQ